MALIHVDADLQPGKLDLLAAWLPTQDWAGPGTLTRVATFRFDDPAGQVGIETWLVRVGDTLSHVPLTYRGAPLDGGALVGEMEHSVLGHRWVYDAATDPVYLDVVRQVIVAGAGEAELTAPDGTALPRAAGAASARGSGVPDGSAAGPIVVLRRIGEQVPAGVGTLVATWAGRPSPAVLVVLDDAGRPRPAR